MSHNKKLINRVYLDCVQIIESSNDTNIESKRKKLVNAYEKLTDSDDWETQEFHSIVHELRVYDFVKRSGIAITASKDRFDGPDFETEFGYIECVCATKGKRGTPQRKELDEALNGTMNRSRATLPRLTSVILDKQKKYVKYQTKDILKQIPCLIALGTSIFSEDFNSDLNLDNAQKILYGIGDQTLLFNANTHSFEDTGGVELYAYSNKGYKGNNIEVGSDYFSEDSYKLISGVILVNNRIVETLSNNCFNILLNPNAIISVDINKLSKFRYFYRYAIEENGRNSYKWHVEET